MKKNNRVINPANEVTCLGREARVCTIPRHAGSSEAGPKEP